MSLGTVLIVEDEFAIREGLEQALETSGYRTKTAATGEDALALHEAPDVVLLDVMLPGLQGDDVLKLLRQRWPRLPVLFVTARGERGDRVNGLRLGADDYICKPFDLDELLARMEAVLRRSAERPAALTRVLLSGRLVDLLKREITRPDGSVRQLPDREAAVMAYLVTNAGRVITRDELLRSVWGIDPRGTRTRTVDMAVARLREHLADDAQTPEIIRTVRGQGYVLVDEPQPADEDAAASSEPHSAVG